jgi:FkbH-like protein
MKVTVETLNEANLERAAQLLNKTNQMNLRTRRLSGENFWRWGHEAGNTVLLFRVQDKFGDYGLVGIGSVRVGAEPEKVAEVADFVLSCRVMGRRVEEALLHVLSRRARAMGATRLRAEYAETDRNKPCRAFFESSGLEPNGARTVFTWDLSKVYAKSNAVVLDADAAARAWFTEAEPCVAG